MKFLTKKTLLLILPLVLTACVGVQPYAPNIPYGVNVSPTPRSHSNSYQQQPQQQHYQQTYQQPYYVKPKHSEHNNYNENYDNGKHKGQYNHKDHDD